MNSNDPDRSLSPSERKRLADMGLERFKEEVLKGQPKCDTPMDRLIGHIMLCHDNVKRAVMPIVKSGGCVPTPENKLSMEPLLRQLYVEQFSKFSKDELEQALAWVYTATAMQGLFPTQLGKSPNM